MSKSVEQAALRRAELGDLPAPWGSVLAAMEASERLNDSRYRHLTETRDAMYEEIAEIRDAMLALSNRIEAATRKPRPEDSRDYDERFAVEPCTQLSPHHPHAWGQRGTRYNCPGVA